MHINMGNAHESDFKNNGAQKDLQAGSSFV